MDCLLIGGAKSVGKSETLYRLAEKLTLVGYRQVAGVLPSTFNDFMVVLEGINKRGIKIRIIISSSSDTVKIIKDFKLFFDVNGQYDVLISSVRDGDFRPRKEFFSIMNISGSIDFILEIPLAKVTRRDADFRIALQWYNDKIDNSIDFIIQNSPFSLM